MSNMTIAVIVATGWWLALALILWVNVRLIRARRPKTEDRWMPPMIARVNQLHPVALKRGATSKRRNSWWKR